MGRVTITLPRLGETMEEARVTDWLVAPGAAFKRGDVLLEVETDKTVVEVPALMDGILGAQLVAPGDMVALDQAIAEVEVEGASDAAPPAGHDGSAIQSPGASTGNPETLSQNPTDGTRTSPPSHGEGMRVGGQPAQGAADFHRPAASPAARAAARRAGVDLAALVGTGRRGRITAQDVGSGPQNGIALHRFGSTGPLIVLLHGLFDDHRGWRDLPRRLAGMGHQVLAVDLPGHGDSRAIAHSFDQAVDQIAAALPAGPMHLIGHSLGGAIAARLACRLRDRVASVLLLAPAGVGPRIKADFTQGMLAAHTPEALSRALSLLDAGPISTAALTQELTRLTARREGHSVLAQAVAEGGFQQIDITQDLHQLRCPLRVLFGTKDRILNWHDVQALPASAAIHLISGAGHLPHLAVPHLIAGFFAREGMTDTIRD